MCRWDSTRPGITWERFMDNKRKELDRLNGVYMKILDSNNVEYHEGRGKLIDAHTVDVDGKRFTVRDTPVPALRHQRESCRALACICGLRL